MRSTNPQSLEVVKVFPSIRKYGLKYLDGGLQLLTAPITVYICLFLEHTKCAFFWGQSLTWSFCQTRYWDIQLALTVTQTKQPSFSPYKPGRSLCVISCSHFRSPLGKRGADSPGQVLYPTHCKKITMTFHPERSKAKVLEKFLLRLKFMKRLEIILKDDGYLQLALSTSDTMQTLKNHCEPASEASTHTHSLPRCYFRVLKPFQSCHNRGTASNRNFGH